MLVNTTDLFEFFRKCQEEKLGGFEQVIVVKKSDHSDGNHFYLAGSNNAEYAIDSVRSVEPLKMLFYFPREQVVPEKEIKTKRLIVGVKACDLKAIQLLDTALINDDFVDPNYKAWRENSYIISTDCRELADSCHCNLMGGKPYPEDGFDLNFSRIDGKFFIYVGTEKGEELLKLLRENTAISEESKQVKDSIQNNRENILAEIVAQNKEWENSAEYQKLRKADLENWKKLSEDCIGCGACTNVCSTCYCMMLNDETKDAEFIKIRSSDSCQLNGYARVAGGDTPKPKMYQRFRNRYLCKFDYMKSNFNKLGCVGCGRCIDACPGEIDIREVVKKNL